MAELIVSLVLDKLKTMLADEANLLLGVRDQIVSLKNQLEWIRGFLMDAEKRSKQFQVVEIWVRQVRDLAYDIDDAIDAFNHNMEQRKNRTIARRIIGFWMKLKYRHRIGNLIQDIEKRSKEISTHRSQYNIDVTLSTQYSGHGTENLASSRRTTPIVEEPAIVGFQKEAAQLADCLVKDEEPQRHVLSIVGMGGLGKTTLAKMIYGRKEVENHFDTRAWIYASQEFQTRDLLISTLKQVKRVITNDEISHLEKMDDGELKLELHKHLQGKTYFVVIDDIWKIEAWERIGAGFPENRNGSRVMLTTRNRDVAIHADPSMPPHELRLLTPDESWELLCKKVFSVTGSCPPELVGVGKRIVERCGGLPLAIVVLGGLLVVKRMTHDEWSRVLASVNWRLSEDSNQCGQILALSYNDLPYYLKSCFLYLGIFPEDFEINVRKLILLWVAEGFLPTRGDEKIEDVAEDCFDELIHRSLIQVVKRRYHDGPVETCRVHDLLRELAISEGRNYRFLDFNENNNNTSASSKSRRLAIHTGITSAYANDFSHSTVKLRSLFIFHRNFKIDIWTSTFGERIKMLRVLDIEGVDLWYRLPQDIGKLVLLQYLGLRNTRTQYIPPFICDLAWLQTLDLRDNILIESLPEGLWKMKQLRHLYLETYSWNGLGHVKSMEKEDLPRNLRTLEISGIIWMEFGGEGLSKVFNEFGCLRSLTLRGKLSGLEVEDCFPSSLTELNLESCLLTKDPSHELERLPYLKELRLSQASYLGKEMRFSAEGFVQLQFLQLHDLGLQEWRVQEGAMASLKHLVISDCQSLRMLPDGLRYVTTLRKIEISFMPKEFQNRVKENGEDREKIRHVPFVICS